VRVFLHGFLGSPEVWNPFVSEGDFAPALVGHEGRAFDENVTSFEDEVARLSAEISAKKSPVHLIGYSLGARLALGIAATIKVAKLTLISGRDGLEDERERAQRQRDDEAWAERFESCGDAEDFARVLALWDAQPVFNSRVHADPRRLEHDPRSIAKAMRALSLSRMPRYAARVQCDNIEILCGYDDAKFRALGEALAAMLNAHVEVIPGAGHDLPREAPEALKRLILQGVPQ
jgi:2-succinyl-6-hydroxy-2,4-cyclohexadiene-1-carboxylate synthase